MASVDLNCDLGEGAGSDAALMAVVSSANVACGGHAGDAATMAETVALARSQGVAVGAHPGFEDREHFGRRELELAPAEIEALVARQLEALAGHGAFGYVKPHGALYNLAARDVGVARAVVNGVRAFDPGLAVMGLAGSVLLEVASAAGCRVIREGFADRRYGDDGGLVPRAEAGAVIADATEASAQAMGLIERGVVDSICVHGDHPGAVEFARALRAGLEGAGVAVAATT